MVAYKVKHLKRTLKKIFDHIGNENISGRIDVFISTLDDHQENIVKEIRACDNKPIYIVRKYAHCPDELKCMGKAAADGFKRLKGLVIPYFEEADEIWPFPQINMVVMNNALINLAKFFSKLEVDEDISANRTLLASGIGKVIYEGLAPIREIFDERNTAFMTAMAPLNLCKKICASTRHLPAMRTTELVEAELTKNFRLGMGVLQYGPLKMTILDLVKLANDSVAIRTFSGMFTDIVLL